MLSQTSDASATIRHTARFRLPACAADNERPCGWELSELLDHAGEGPLSWLGLEFRWDEVVFGDDWPNFSNAILTCMQRGGEFNVSCRLFDGRTRPVRATVSGRLILDAVGEPVCIEGAIDAHTGPVPCTGCREAVIQGERKAREFSRHILAVLSHDIRSPLIGVIGMLQLLRKAGLTERQEEFATLASDSCERILELAKNLLDFSRIDSGRDCLMLQPVNLSDVVDSVVRMHMEQALRLGIFLEVHRDLDFPEVVLSDEVKFRQILGNLVSNAIKFTPDGTVRVALSHLPRADGEITVLLEVSDTGIGFELAQTDLMFDQFSQLCRDQSLRRMGAGLGLSIVKGLVDLFGGSICADSTPGEGATFCVSFPASLA